MTAVEPRGALEREVLEKLAKRGWQVHEAKRDKIDLDLSVSFGQTRGSIRFRNAFDVPRSVASAASAPSFLRIDLGQPAGEPSRWAVWDKIWSSRGAGTPRVPAPGWSRGHRGRLGRGGGLLGHAQADLVWALRTIETLLLRAEKLAPGQDEDARREQIFASAAAHFDAQTRRGREIAFIVGLRRPGRRRRGGAGRRPELGGGTNAETRPRASGRSCGSSSPCSAGSSSPRSPSPRSSGCASCCGSRASPSRGWTPSRRPCAARAPSPRSR